jgi:hypothetical protein
MKRLHNNINKISKRAKDRERLSPSGTGKIQHHGEKYAVHETKQRISSDNRRLQSLILPKVHCFPVVESCFNRNIGDRVHEIEVQRLDDRPTESLHQKEFNFNTSHQ